MRCCLATGTAASYIAYLAQAIFTAADMGGTTQYAYYASSKGCTRPHVKIA